MSPVWSQVLHISLYQGFFMCLKIAVRNWCPLNKILQCKRHKPVGLNVIIKPVTV